MGELDHGGPGHHLPRLLQQQVADPADCVVLPGPLGHLALLALGTTFGIVGQIHAVDPGIGIPVEAGRRRFDARQGVVAREGALIRRHAGPEGLDAALHQSIDPVAGQQLGQAPQ